MNDIVKSENKAVVETQNDYEKVNEDFDSARKNLYETIATSSKALTEMADVAYQSQHPAAYDVLNNMLKVMSTLNKDLVELQKRKKDIMEKREQNNTSVVKEITNHNTFVGSTAELAEALSKKK